MPLGVLEQPDAPFNGRAQCALTLGKIDGAGTQGVETIFEPSEQCTRFEQSSTGRCELYRERQTVEAPADLRNGQCVVLGQGEVVADGLRSVDEQPNGRERGQRFHWRLLREHGHGQRTDRVLPLGPEPKHGLARREDLEAGAAGQKLIELGRDTHDLFHVVQHEQRGRLPEVLDQDVQRSASALDGRAHRVRDARQHQLGLSDRRERHEHRPVRIAIIELFAHGDRQPRLADAAGAREGDQPDFGFLEQFRDLGDVVLPSDQRRRRQRQGALAPPVGLDGGRCRTVGGATGSREPLAQEQGEVVPDESPELPWAPERTV